MTTPNKNQAVVAAKRTVADLINSPKMIQEIAKVLPKHLTPDRMTRVALTATMKNPALLNCTPESLTNALLTCSQAGLEPDGRLAHLIPYGNTCQVIFDYKGLVTLARRNGASTVFADKVCQNDLFEAGVIDGKKVLNHKPNWKGERGAPYAYYAVTISDGETDWEVMSLEEVESVRQRSRAKDSGPWVTDFDEMGKKTVLRRMSKRWDLIPEIRDVINNDDDTPGFGQVLSVSKPMFEAPKKIAAKVEEPARESEAPQPDSPEEPAPEPAKPEPEVKATSASGHSYNPLKALRSLLATAHITEGKLLDHLTSVGATDGSSSSLDELAMVAPQVLQHVAENWQEYLPKLKGNK